jgi:kumamolisin
VRFHHHLAIPGGQGASFGPQDLRRQYNAQPLLDLGYVGQDQKTVVLSTALPPGTEVNPLDVQYFYKNISDVKAPLVINTMFNPQRDYDRQRGGASEFELDVEMHSVGVPGATSITLEVSPASEVFTAGADDIVNHMADATAVSVSLGLCEEGEQQNDTATGTNEIATMHQSVIQGTMEGQSWSAASGDNGANDCGNNTASVDFPSSIPEMIAAGGVMPTASNPFNKNGAILSYTDETAWGGGFGAGGGGISVLFPLPAYQTALSSLGSMRLSPDIALIAGGVGVVTDSSGIPGQLDPVLGTSVASPLSAGFFALIASYQGCRLGDPHAALYQMGLIQADGGTAVFHDITTGNISQGSVMGARGGAGVRHGHRLGRVRRAGDGAELAGLPAAASARRRRR